MSTILMPMLETIADFVPLESSKVRPLTVKEREHFKKKIVILSSFNNQSHFACKSSHCPFIGRQWYID